MLNLSIKCTRFERNYSSCAARSSENLCSQVLDLQKVLQPIPNIENKVASISPTSDTNQNDMQFFVMHINQINKKNFNNELSLEQKLTCSTAMSFTYNIISKYGFYYTTQMPTFLIIYAVCGYL